MTGPTPRDVALARQTLAADRKAKREIKRATFGPRPFPKREKATHGRERDKGYLAWLHDGLPCIACNVLGETGSPIEAAHQKLNVAARGIQKSLGVRPSDWLCLPLCAAHHRLREPCCDPAQAKFWALLGLEPVNVVDFCAALHLAYRQEEDGAEVVRDFASLAAGQRRAT